MMTSEIRRVDRRGTSPEHILYMAVKLFRYRVSQGLYTTFRHVGNASDITRRMWEDSEFLQRCISHNFAFLKSIPNSVQYWMYRKKELFAMIRQLGKPTFVLTMSANEVRWPHLLALLHRMRGGGPVLDPLKEFTAAYRAFLVHEDSVVCCIYFWKMMECLLKILQSSRLSPSSRSDAC